jgi:hypothetical protein
MPIRARTVGIDELPPERIDRMLGLMRDHFQNVDEGRFREDLGNKRWVILLEDGTDLCGFSTQTTVEVDFEGRPVLVFYSGDTVIARARWGTMALPLEFIRLVFREGRKAPGKEPFWLLTAKGFRTYRFLPVFFETFYPRHDREGSDFERRLTDRVAGALFGRRYDPGAGLLRASPADQRLWPEHADVPARELKDPHVAYFLARNPGFAAGDELVCLASVSAGNFKAFARARVGLAG